MTNAQISSRPPTTKNDPMSTARPTFISCGKREQQLLRFIMDLNGHRFSRRGFSRYYNLPPSTVKDNIDSLIRKGLLEHPYVGQVVLTELGKSALDFFAGGVGTRRRECRSGQISQHYTRFECPIISSKFTEFSIPALHPTKWKPVKLTNFTQYILYYEDVTVIINKKSLVFRIQDCVSDDQEEGFLDSFQTAVRYAERFSRYFEIDRMQLTAGHWARTNSLLAEFLKKIDERYFLELSDGKKLWIDLSDGKLEDETDDQDTRQRLDTFLDDMLKSDSLISDVDKMKDVMAMMIKFKAMEMKSETLPEPTKPEYVG